MSAFTSNPTEGASAAAPPKPTNFDDDPIVLETDIENSQVQEEALLRAWVELCPHSVEAALANQSDLEEFGNTHCLFFAAVLWNHTITLSTRLTRELWPAQWYEEPAQPAASTSAMPEDGADTNAIAAEDPSTSDAQPTSRVWDTVGVVYIASSPLPSQVHIGICILPDFRAKGLGRRACEIALGWAIDTLQMHRVQARLLPSPYQHRARSLFAALGLVHEGVHRRAVLSATGEWADVAHMGVLATDWHLRAHLRAAPRSLWDELLDRHQREVEEMLRYEARQRALRRTSSMETVRVAAFPSPVPEWLQRGRVACSPAPPSLIPTAPSSRASSEAPIDAGTVGSDPMMRYRGDETPQSPGSEAGDDALMDDPRWVRFFENMPTQHTLQSPENEPIPRPPSSASDSSFASMGSFSAGPRRRRSYSDDDDEDWVSLQVEAGEGGSTGYSRQ